LFLFSGFVVAKISAPDCNTSWRWSYNSLGQNACTVAAYLMSTCNGGCELSSLLCPCINASSSLVVSSLSQHSASMLWPPDTTTRGQVVMMTPICASATLSHIPSLVHVSRAKEKSGFHGRNICITAPRFCLPRRSLTLSPTEHVSPTGLSSTSQLRTLGTLSKLIL